MHKLRHVIGLIRAKRDPPSSPIVAINQFQRRLPLGSARRLANTAPNRQAMAVLHQGMPDVAKLGRLPVTLLVEPCVRISRALVGVIGALLLVEVAFCVAPRALAVVVAPVLSPETLDRGPRLDQSAVHREVLA